MKAEVEAQVLRQIQLANLQRCSTPGFLAVTGPSLENFLPKEVGPSLWQQQRKTAGNEAMQGRNRVNSPI